MGDVRDWLNNPAYWILLRQFLQARTVNSVAIGGTWEKWLGRTAEEACEGLRNYGALERAYGKDGKLSTLEELLGGELLVCGDWARRGVEEFWGTKKIPLGVIEEKFGEGKNKEGEEDERQGEDKEIRQLREKALEGGVDQLTGNAGAAIYEWLGSVGEKLTPRPEKKAEPTLPEGVMEPQRGRREFEPEMVKIPAGEFLMGSDKQVDSRAREDELPQQRVYLGEYYMGKYPVTNREYQAFIEGGGYLERHWWSEEGWTWKSEQRNLKERHLFTIVKDNHPAVITWFEAEAYCSWLSLLSGRDYRLPTEAEWEKAARGTDGRIYPWGNEFDQSLCNTGGSGIHGPSAVDAHPGGKSPFGLYDVAGNVYEWTASWYQAYPGAVFQSSDYGIKYKVLRGGSWGFNQRAARCACRGRFAPDDIFSYFAGFRVCSPG